MTDARAFEHVRLGHVQPEDAGNVLSVVSGEQSS